jgi:hypothetical protein
MATVQNTDLGRNYLKLAPNISTVIPAYLREMKRWTAWKFIPPKKAGAKPGKFPCSVVNDSGTWRTFSEALDTPQAGIGFMMLGAHSLCGIDLDGCVDPTTGAVAQFATSLLAALPDTYAELSPSGKGIRIFATIPEGMRVPEFLSKAHGVECYVGKSSRYLTVTGHVLPGRAGLIGAMTTEAVKMLSPIAGATGGGTELEIKLPVPQIERTAEWQKILDGRLAYTKLKKEWREYLETGDLPGGRSERSFAIACKLLEARYTADEVFAVLLSAPGSWEAALDKRDQDVTRARALIWADIGRAQKVIRSDEMSLASRVDDWAGLGLRTELRNKRVQVQRSQLNAVRILTDHTDWRGRVALDVTSGRVLLDSTPLDDFRFFEMQEKVSAYAGWDPNAHRQWWVDLIRAVAERNPINPREVELRAMKWDGTPRLDTWFTQYVADEDEEINRVIGRKWILSCVARWLDPGCKVDTVLILQGLEGARKNTLLEIIAGGTDRVIPCDGFERDDKYTVAQAWIAEMPEASIFRRADRNRLKAFIVQAIDHYRPPYAANPVAVKRAFVLASTSNRNENLFNTDQDGLRRFWPVWVRERIEYEKVAEIREQMLAEAVLAYDLGEQWWFETTPDALRERVEFAVESTALDEAIEILVKKQTGRGGLNLTEILLELGATLGYRPQDRTVSMLLEKHGIRRRRQASHRFWLHPTWARPGEAGEADVIPLHGRQTAEAQKRDELDEVLS